MFFLRYNGDQFDRIQQVMHPFDPAAFGSGDPRLAWNVTQVLRADERVGLFNEQNLGWVGLEADEQFLLELVDGSPLSAILARAPAEHGEALRAALAVLYGRGLVTANGRPYVSNAIFLDGPLYHHTYLIELLLTERCNLRCRYCFAEVDNRKQLMPEATAEVILRRVLELPTHRLFVEFSGGEVFLNLPTFTFAVEYLRRNAGDKTITIVAQTNAELLNEEIVAFCAAQGVQLSLTLDGPRAIHDRQRINWAGGGSYDKVVRSIRLLQRHMVPFGVIGVVTGNSMGRAAEMLAHYSELGITRVKLNHLTPQGYSREAWPEIGIDGLAYLGFMQEVYTWIKANDGAVVESNLEVYLLNLIARTSQYRCTRTACRAGAEFLVFDPQGDIFPCPRFKNNPATLLGNVFSAEGRVDRLYLDNELVAGIEDRNVNTIALCGACEWRNACRGGCSLETYEAFHALDRESGICSFYKGIYPFLFGRLLADTAFIGSHLLADATLVDLPFGAMALEHEERSS